MEESKVTFSLIKGPRYSHFGLSQTKKEKKKGTLLSATLKVTESKVPYFFNFWPRDRDIATLSSWKSNHQNDSMAISQPLGHFIG